MASIKPTKWGCLLVCVTSLFILTGCKEQPLRRPYGFIKLGPILDLTHEETVLNELRLVVRRDEVGFSVMSTLCTYDLSPLVKQQIDGKEVWGSTLTTSMYTSDGKVLKGPATYPLPYYNILMDSSALDGPLDLVFAEVSEERSPSWRFTKEMAVKKTR